MRKCAVQLITVLRFCSTALAAYLIEKSSGSSTKQTVATTVTMPFNSITLHTVMCWGRCEFSRLVWTFIVWYAESICWSCERRIVHAYRIYSNSLKTGVIHYPTTSEYNLSSTTALFIVTALIKCCAWCCGETIDHKQNVKFVSTMFSSDVFVSWSTTFNKAF